MFRIKDPDKTKIRTTRHMQNKYIYSLVKNVGEPEFTGLSRGLQIQAPTGTRVTQRLGLNDVIMYIPCAPGSGLDKNDF